MNFWNRSVKYEVKQFERDSVKNVVSRPNPPHGQDPRPEIQSPFGEPSLLHFLSFFCPFHFPSCCTSFLLYFSSPLLFTDTHSHLFQTIIFVLSCHPLIVTFLSLQPASLPSRFRFYVFFSYLHFPFIIVTRYAAAPLIQLLPKASPSWFLVPFTFCHILSFFTYLPHCN